MTRTQAARHRPHNLPAELTSFIGRREELAEVKRLLGTTRLLTLTGPGGAGKTRLALRAAADLVRSFPAGAWVVELASLQDPALVTQAVFGALDLRDQSGSWLAGALSDYLAPRRLLLVLDNCEHLLAASAVLADTLLRTCPELRILATSREPLGIAGEVRMTVPSLSLPERQDGKRGMLISDAVRLFADRAAAVLPGWTITAENQDAVARLCHRLDGIPLALELAAVRLPVLGVDEIVERLDDRFRLLTTGSRTALPRHRTLRATIEWSRQLLTEDEQLLWARLSVFAGGFDLEAAESVCADDRLPRPSIVDLLEALVAKSILAVDRQSGRRRLTLLETIRQFGHEQLAESGEEEELRRRHRDWVAGIAARVEAEGGGPAQKAWFDRMAQEQANLRAALDYCLTTPGEADAGLTMCAQLELYWRIRGYISEGWRWISALLEKQTAPTVARAHALRVATVLALWRDELEVAEDLGQRALSLARQLKDPGATAWSLHYLGHCALVAGDVSRAAELGEQSLELARIVLDPPALATMSSLGAQVALASGDPSRAGAIWQEAIDSSRSRGDRLNLSSALWGMGFLHLARQGQHQAALGPQTEALAVKRELDERYGIALLIETIAWSTAALDRVERAACLLGAAQAAREAVPMSLPRMFAAARTDAEAAARSRLGDQAFAAALQEGARMDFAEAVAYALEEKPSPARRRPRERAILTRREADVTALVAAGMSNKEIATRLFISERTAETHIENIMNKLGVSSRAQVAAWATEQQSAPG